MARPKKSVLEENSVVDKIEILLDNSIQIRTRNQVLKNGDEIAYTFHRHVLPEGSDLTGEEDRVVAIATALWNLGS